MSPGLSIGLGVFARYSLFCQSVADQVVSTFLFALPLFLLQSHTLQEFLGKYTIQAYVQTHHYRGQHLTNPQCSSQ